MNLHEICDSYNAYNVVQYAMLLLHKLDLNEAGDAYDATQEAQGDEFCHDCEDVHDSCECYVEDDDLDYDYDEDEDKEAREANEATEKDE